MGVTRVIQVPCEPPNARARVRTYDRNRVYVRPETTLTTNGQLHVFEPTDKQFKQVASYKVAEDDAYAYPVVAGNRLYIKDFDSVILWTVD